MKKKLGIAAASAGALITGVVVYMATPSDPVAVGVEPAVPYQFELPPMYEVGSAESGHSYTPVTVLAVETNSAYGGIQIPELSIVDAAQDIQPDFPSQSLGPVDESVSEQVQFPSSHEVQVEVSSSDSGFYDMNPVDAASAVPEAAVMIHNPVSVATNIPVSRWTLVGGIGVYGSRAWALLKEGQRQELLGNKEAADKIYIRLLLIADEFE